MASVVGCAVFTEQDPATAFMVGLHHYDRLRDAVDAGEKGWVELDAAEGEDGKVMLRIQDITCLILQTESVVAAATARQLANG